MKRKVLLSVTLILMVFWSAALMGQTQPEYYFSTTVEMSFDDAMESTKAALKENGFGIITEVHMDQTLMEKLDGVEMKRYTMLGACNPKYAYETLQVEENIGLFLPCKVLIKEISERETEVVMINPTELMKMLGNEKLDEVAKIVTEKFQSALREID